MSDQDERIKRIVRTHARYEEERIWDKFLLDAYAGTGGFEGKVRMPFASFWGAGADLYSNSAFEAGAADESSIDTYIDRYPREDLPKFNRRASIANYPNPVEPVVDIRLSYLNRKPMTYSGIEQLTEGAEPWFQNVDGRGTDWETIMRSVVQIRAAVLGWCPVLFDMPLEPEDDQQLSVDRAHELGIRPRVLPLFPANLYDWEEDDRGELTAAKVGTHYLERADLLEEPTCVHRVTIWERHRVRIFEIVKVENKDVIRAELELPNRWGVVPIVICRAKPAPTDSIRGLSMVGSIAKLAKRLFNYLSELDEHLRGSTFAILQVPCDNPDQIGTIVTGVGNALPVPTTSSQEYKFISPDSSVAEVYERRVEVTGKDIARIGRTEYTSGSTSGQQKSGLSRAFEFENTNRAIADTASSFARFIQLSFQLVGRMEGMSEEDISKIRATPPTKFDVEEMAKEIEEALAAKGLGLGPTAVAEMAKRLVRKLLPNLDEKTLAKIDSEIDQQAVDAEEDRAFQRAETRAGLGDDEEQEGDDEEDDEDVDQAA